jgi:hypothetical protein
MMTAATSFGFESIGTWLVSNSVVFAFMRFAKKRSSSGAIARSFVATMYHDGFVFHATLDTLVPKAEAIIGPCVAARTRASAAGKSQAKCFTIVSVGRLMKPFRPEDLRIVDNGQGFAATVARALYQGGRTTMDAAPALDPGTTLSLSVQSSEAPSAGSAIRLALIDGWVIPNR